MERVLGVLCRVLGSQQLSATHKSSDSTWTRSKNGTTNNDGSKSYSIDQNKSDHANLSRYPSYFVGIQRNVHGTGFCMLRSSHFSIPLRKYNLQFCPFFARITLFNLQTVDCSLKNFLRPCLMESSPRG